MTYEKLSEAWRLRDARYRMRRTAGTFRPLSEAEQQSIIWMRKLECERLLEGADRMDALNDVDRWVAPVGNLR